jgi:hypothetical protein
LTIAIPGRVQANAISEAQVTSPTAHSRVDVVGGTLEQCPCGRAVRVETVGEGKTKDEKKEDGVAEKRSRCRCAAPHRLIGHVGGAGSEGWVIAGE